MRTPRLAWVCAAFVFVGAACGSNASFPSDAGVDAEPDAGSLPDAGPPEELAVMCGGEPETVEDWERCYLKRHCETRLRCGDRNLYSDVQECIDLLDAVNGGLLAFEARERRRAIDAGRAALDVEAFTQCLREWSPRRCNTAATAPVCAARFVGTIADGAACYSDSECASSGARCAPRDCGDSCCLGVCEPLAKLGETCTELLDACEPGLICDLSQQTCVIGDIGAQCTRYGCDANAWCDEAAGICKPDLAEGTKCNSLLQCGGETFCVGLRGDDFEAARCRRVTEPGDACDFYCFGNLYCDFAGTEALGVCRPLPKHGEGCDPLTAPCLGRNERCDGGRCVARADVGEPCSDGTCRPELFCTDQLSATEPVCQPRAGVGATCNQPGQCQSYICSGNQSAPGECQPTQAVCQ